MKLDAYLVWKDKLEKPYLEAFEAIEYYGQVHLVPDKLMAEKMMDLIDLMLEAQKEGRPVETMVGTDVDEFCKNYFAEASARHFAVSIFRMTRRVLLFFSVLELIFFLAGSLEEGLAASLKAPTSISEYLAGLMAAVGGMICSNLVGMFLSRRGRYSQKRLITISVGICVLIAAVTFGIFACLPEVKVSGGAALAILFGMFVCFWLFEVIYRYTTTGSIREKKTEYQMTFFDMVKAEAKNNAVTPDSVKTFAKQYRKKNARRIKRGKQPFTTEEFFAWQGTNVKRTMLWVMSVDAVILVVLSVLLREILFEGWMDLVIFDGLIMGVTGFVLFIEYKLARVGRKFTGAIVAACKEAGMEVDEYWEQMEKKEDSPGISL